MIQDKYKHHLHFAYFMTGEKRRPEKELKQFIKDGGGHEIDFGNRLENDPKFVKDQFLLWERS